MRAFEDQLNELRNDLLEMWNLVISQMTKAQQAFLNTDKELAREIGYFEKKVDVFELKIDKDCELYIALNNPVAIDLRFVLSILKINTALERLGDFAKGISRRVIDYPVDKPNSDLMKIM
ncbi:MAG: PhoU domain-containing protein, partial [Bacteroidales bacterium]